MRKRISVLLILVLAAVMVMTSGAGVFAAGQDSLGLSGGSPAGREAVDTSDKTGSETSAVADKTRSGAADAITDDDIVLYTDSAMNAERTEITDTEQDIVVTGQTAARTAQETGSGQDSAGTSQAQGSGTEQASSGTAQTSGTEQTADSTAQGTGTDQGSSAEEQNSESSQDETGAHIHSYGRWKLTVVPSYFKPGMQIRTCSCGEYEVKRLPKKTARKEWVKEGGKKYYFGSNGRVYRGWHKIRSATTGKERWYCFDSKGVYLKSVSTSTRSKWVYAGSSKYYFNKSKKPVGKGFQMINGKVYYMNKYGAVKYGTFTASDGLEYTAEEDGSLPGYAYYRFKYNTFVLVDISEQTIWYCKDGKLQFKSDVVTGRRGVHDTPTGIFSVRSKSTNIYLVGPTWRSHVNYWMAFLGSSYGLHDAPWRSSRQFSNHNTYKYNGSHGCINLRPSIAKKLYYSVSIGTPVIVTR